MPKLSDLLWDYLPDKQALQGMGNDLLAAANRAGVAAVLGAPVDIANQLANLGKALYGYAGNKAGLLSADQMPQLDERPIGGSEWIGQKMQDAGLINNNRNALAELLAGMVMPGAMLRGGVKANQAMDAAIANAQRPNTLNTPGYKGQRGAIMDIPKPSWNGREGPSIPVGIWDDGRPIRSEVNELLKDEQAVSAYNTLRTLLDQKTGTLYGWPADAALHQDVGAFFKLDPNKAKHGIIAP